MTEEELLALSDLVMEEDRINIIGAVPREDLDLEVENGDLKLITGIDNLKRSLVRRLKTALGSYGMLAGGLSSSGAKTVTLIGETYGTRLGDLMSEPITNDWIRHVLDTLQSALVQEERIRVVNVGLTIADLVLGRVRFDIDYRIIGAETEDNLGIETSSEGFVVG
jgi:phage baseplate assembly protein W